MRRPIRRRARFGRAEQHGVLVALDPGGRVDVAHVRRDAVGGAPQCVVDGEMTLTIVERLEPVAVDEDQRADTRERARRRCSAAKVRRLTSYGSRVRVSVEEVSSLWLTMWPRAPS